MGQGLDFDASVNARLLHEQHRLRLGQRVPEHLCALEDALHAAGNNHVAVDRPRQGADTFDIVGERFGCPGEDPGHGQSNDEQGSLHRPPSWLAPLIFPSSRGETPGG
jgi:hypothetical protein